MGPARQSLGAGLSPTRPAGGAVTRSFCSHTYGGMSSDAGAASPNRLGPLWAPPAEVNNVSGLSAEIREGLTTTVLHAVPDTRYAYPRPEIWPFVAAVSVTAWLVWSVWSVPGFAWGLIPPAVAFIAWYWPNRKEAVEEVSWEIEP